MPTFEDWLNDPVSIINNIFGKNLMFKNNIIFFQKYNLLIFVAFFCVKGSDKFNFDTKVQEYFQNKLSLEKNYYSVRRKKN